MIMPKCLKCIKDFPMNNGTIAFYKGKSYAIKDCWFEEWWEYEVQSEISDSHMMPFDDETKEFFIVE